MTQVFKRFPFLITPVQYGVTLLLYFQCSMIIGISLYPSALFIYLYWIKTEMREIYLRLLGLSLLLAVGYFLYAIILIFVVGCVCGMFRLKIKEGRYYIYSWDAIRWATYNSLILIVRYTCMNFLRVTPFLNLFYRMMGATIGKNVQINTCIIGDCSLLEIGDDTVIGGDVTLVAHVVEHDQLIIKKVKIGTHVTVGLMSIIMPGVDIGDHVMIAAHSVIKKDTVIPSNSKWGGVPAKPLDSIK